MKKGFIVGLLIFTVFVIVFAGATNFDRIVLGSGNYGTDPNTSADITLQNDEYIDNSTDGTIDFGSANLSSTGTLSGGNISFTGTLSSDSSATFGTINFATSNNNEGSDSLALTLSPALTTLQTGTLVLFVPDTANTGAFVVNVNGLGWKDVKTASGANPANSDLVTTMVCILVYDGTDFHLINPATTTD